MTISEAVIGLLSDDRYLLCEVLGSSEVQASLQGQPTDRLIDEVNKLIEQGVVMCTVGPLIGGEDFDALAPEKAIELISSPDAWAPPQSDHIATIWLERGDLQ